MCEGHLSVIILLRVIPDAPPGEVSISPKPSLKISVRWLEKIDKDVSNT